MIWIYLEIVFYLLQLLFVIVVSIYSALNKPQVQWKCYKEGGINLCE